MRIHILIYSFILQQGEINSGLQSFFETFNKLLDQSDFKDLAKSCEKCVQILTSLIVKTADQNVKVTQGHNMADLDTWVNATAPARIDLAGGWTDTPPICMHFGGKVCGLAIQVDGKVSKEGKILYEKNLSLYVWEA